MTIFDAHEFGIFLVGEAFRTRQFLRKADWPKSLIYRDAQRAGAPFPPAEQSEILALSAGDVVSDGKNFRVKLTAKTAAAYKTLELIARMHSAIAAGEAPHVLAAYAIMLGECRVVMMMDGGLLDPRTANLRKRNAARRASADAELLEAFAAYCRDPAAAAAPIGERVEQFARQKTMSKKHRKRIRELHAEGAISIDR